MAEAKPSIFNQKAQDRLRSPDDLDKYVRITSPSMWVVLASIVSLTAGLLIWGIFGSLSPALMTSGTTLEGRTICLLSANEVTSIAPGDKALVNGVEATVESVSTIPLSRSEVNELLGSDYLTEALMQEEWAHLVMLKTSEPVEEGTLLIVSITTERVSPLSLILG